MKLVSNQKGMVIWMLGFSGAGKSTLSNLLEQKLRQENVLAIQLDGDELRKGLNSNLGFSMDDRAENIRRAAETAKIMAAKGIVVICSFITPLQSHREIAKAILAEMYYEVFIDCPISVCAERDVKGLYKMAEEKTLKNLTGMGSEFERPSQPDLIISTDKDSLSQCLDQLYTYLTIQKNPGLSKEGLL